MSDPLSYTVGWICAVEPEAVAAGSLLDDEHEPPQRRDPQDTNVYKLGSVAGHNVVIASLPLGEYGTNSAAVVAANLLRSFPNIRIGLSVGIGGGAPSHRHDIRLGDVVVGVPGDGKGGVIQYDMGKRRQGQTFEQTGCLNASPVLLRTAVAALRATYARKGHTLAQDIADALNRWPRMRMTYSRPGVRDILYRSQCVREEEDCGGLSRDEGSANIVERQLRDGEEDPTIHYGLIASANTLMKDAEARDQISEKHNILCFETIAAGLMNHFPCLVVRGICDYADSHENKVWQGYAAMTAAAYAKDLLRQISAIDVEREHRVEKHLNSCERASYTLQHFDEPR